MNHDNTERINITNRGTHSGHPSGGRSLGHRKGMAIGSINVNSLLLHIDEVRQLIKEKGFHILAIYETKLDETIPDSLLDVKGCARNRRWGYCLCPKFY